MTEIRSFDSTFICCKLCDRTIAFLDMHKNKLNNWNQNRHNSNGTLIFTLCRSCEDSITPVRLSNLYSRPIPQGRVVNSGVFSKCSRSITGKLTIKKSNNLIPTYCRAEVFNMCPNKYRLVVINSSKSWPIDSLVPGDFL